MTFPSLTLKQMEDLIEFLKGVNPNIIENKHKFAMKKDKFIDLLKGCIKNRKEYNKEINRRRHHLEK